jgi:hypothetical protein
MLVEYRNQNEPEDKYQVNILNNHEVEYWTSKFGVTAEALRNAVHKVGTVAEDVERELKRKRY